MAHTVVLEFPQWQGSCVKEARRLAHGTKTIRRQWDRLAAPKHTGDTLVVRVPVRDNVGPNVDGIYGLAEVLTHARWAVAALYEHKAERVITLGGDCGVEMAPVAYVNDRHEGLTVLWLDAHADANSPQQSPSHAFHGMVLRHLAGDGHNQLKLSPELRVEPEQLVLAGVRDLDPDERAFISSHRIACLSPDETTAADVVAELAGRGGPVYIHLDLDVVDPGELGSVGCPSPGGLSVRRVKQVLRAVHQSHEVVGMSMTEYLPLPRASSVAAGGGSGSTLAAEDDVRDEAIVARLLAALVNC